jgi:hypothetical protein
MRRLRPARRAVLIGLLATVKVEIHGAPGCTDPHGLVELAVAKKREREREARDDLTKAEFEEVWVIFDVEHAGNGRQPAIPGAVQAALREGLLLGISNPSFEVWYILHDRPTPPGLTCSDDARPLLEKLVGRKLDKSMVSANALAEWAMPYTAVAMRNGARQDVFDGEPSQTSAHVPTTTGTGMHFVVGSLVAMSSDGAGKRSLGFSEAR